MKRKNVFINDRSNKPGIMVRFIDAVESVGRVLAMEDESDSEHSGDDY